MKTDLHFEKRNVYCGAGVILRRWVVIQDGGVKDWCLTSEDAERRIEGIRRNWESKDE